MPGRASRSFLAIQGPGFLPELCACAWGLKVEGPQSPLLPEEPARATGRGKAWVTETHGPCNLEAALQGKSGWPCCLEQPQEPGCWLQEAPGAADGVIAKPRDVQKPMFRGERRFGEWILCFSHCSFKCFFMLNNVFLRHVRVGVAAARVMEGARPGAWVDPWYGGMAQQY